MKYNLNFRYWQKYQAIEMLMATYKCNCEACKRVRKFWIDRIKKIDRG